MNALPWVLVVALATLALAAPPPAVERGVLEPKMHFVSGSGDLEVSYRVLKPFAASRLRVPGLAVRDWRVSNEAGEQRLTVRLRAQVGRDAEWQTVEITDRATKKVRVFEVGWSRALWSRDFQTGALEFERIEQQFGRQLAQRPYWGVRLFNDADQPVTIERLIYAPKGAITARVALQNRYDPNWFSDLGAWAASPTQTLPGGARLVDAERVGLSVLPSRGFSMAILGLSFQPSSVCQKPGVHMDTLALQPVIQYRVGASPSRYYALPDTITAPLCP
jgi:hypothetical protein